MATHQEGVTLLSRFHGTILGAVFGDCFGDEFEDFWSIMRYEPVVKYYEEVISQHQSMEAGVKGNVKYTDDTCMTFDLGESLVKYEEFNPEDVAKSFAETFYASPPQRCYGGDVSTIFDKLKESGYQCNPFGPAKEQFGGSGSYGNGSAMRASPVALFHHNNKKEMVNLASNQSKLTHTNAMGINGAILQTLAIDKAMTSGNIQNTVKFAEELMKELKKVTPAKKDLKVYKERMKSVTKLLEQKHEVTGEDINEEIKTDVTAQEAVPAAIFCFLYTLDSKNIPKLSNFNGLVRTIILAAAVSRDSDTIASMAGAIAGAYYGVELIPTEWVEACEGADRALKLANDLYEINMKSGKEKK